MRLFIVALLAGAFLTGCQPDSTEMTSELGNRYRLYKEGSGDVAAVGEYVYFHAQMRTEADSVLFSTYDSGGEMPVVQIAPLDDTEVGPVEDVLRYMRLGDSATVRVNIEKFPNKPPGMELDTVIIYNVRVKEVLTEEEFEIKRDEITAKEEAKRDVVRVRGEERRAFAETIRQQYADGELENIQETESGLKYVIHEPGTGPQAQPGQEVLVQYIGQLTDNSTVFDESFSRGSAIPFRLGSGQVIPGWDEGIALLKEGGQATLMVPSNLAYGASGTPDGSIPANSELVFYVELEKVNE